MWYESILQTVGKTPLVRINRLAEGLPGTLLAKLEYFNPGASVKDRIGLAMIEAAEREGRLKPGGVIVEGTSGNTGAGLALAAITRGYKCIFTTTDKQSEEKLNVLRALGAEVIVCPTAVAPEDPRSYYSVARRLAEELPNAVYLNQYDNPANAAAHYATTGPELWEATEGRITHLIAGAGTGGAISGAARFLKERRPDLKVIGVDPYGSVYYKYFHTRVFDHAEIYPYLTEGVGEDILAGNMDFDLVDDYVRVTDRDTMLMTRRLARQEGFFAGQSSGMAVAGALAWMQAHADALAEESVLVVLLPDGGFRYLSKTYNDNWMRNHGFTERTSGLTAASVLGFRRRSRRLLSAAPSDTLGEAIRLMAAHGVSQLPVIEEGAAVGSITEHHVLRRLVERPGAEEALVREVMDAPFPVAPRTLHLEQLTALLDEGAAAVLVETPGGGHEIITRSDLISALAASGRTETES